jgi:hypothetical protein
MTKALFVLLGLGWLVFALSGYVVGYVVDYENGSSATYYFLMLDNGTLIPLVEPPPYYLVGTGKRVEAELVFTEVGVGARVLAPREPTLTPALTIPRQPVSGPLLVTLVAAKFADVSFEPYNMSYIHDVVFGPFPSMRHFWESASDGAVVIRPYYIHWDWVTLPRNGTQYCSALAPHYIGKDVINILYSEGIRLPSYSYLIIVLNYRPSCFDGIGMATLRFWEFDTPYGRIWLAVSLIFHYTNYTRYNPDLLVISHEFGHNLGLHHAGTGAYDLREYDNYWDVMGNLRLWRRLNSWFGVTNYCVPNGLTLPHLYFLGWGSFVGSGEGAWLLGPRSGVYIPDPFGFGVYTVEYKCGDVYEQFLDWCGVVVHRVYNLLPPSRWVYFHAVLNVTGVIVSPVNFLDVGQSAWVAGQRVSVVWRNLTHARIVVGLPTLADVVGANATFVVGSGAATIDSVAAVYARTVFSPTATFTLPVFHYEISNSRMHFNPLFAYLDDEQWLTQVRYYSMGSGWLYYPVRYPGVVVSVGGPLANSFTRALNPPDRPGAGGLPFYYDTTAGGIKDAVSGQVWRSNAAVVAVVPNGSRVYVLVWGLGGEDTRRAARWLAECMPPRAYAVVINTTDFHVLASWPSGFVGASVCPGAVYTAAAVVGANAASIDAVGAAMAAGGLGLLDSEVEFGCTPSAVCLLCGRPLG